MLAITCDKCRRRYTATDEELHVYLQQTEGKKYAQVLCPHCGKPSKVAADRIRQALRFSPASKGEASAAQEPGAEKVSSGETAELGLPPEEVDPAA